MNVTETSIPGVFVVESSSFSDHRGAFSRLFCGDELGEVLGERKIVQINYSRTKKKGAIRGLHYQKAPFAEMKLVRCLRGRVWDVVVDVRSESPTFLQWHAEELSSENSKMIVIPEGCAHGFQVIESESELLYLHTEYYTPNAECGLRFDDPLLNIAWPLLVEDISERDSKHPLLDIEFSGISI